MYFLPNGVIINMDNDKLGYKIHYINCTDVELAIKPVRDRWYLYVFKYGNGTKWLSDSCILNEQGHKDIADLIEIPWEYYKRCLDEYHPVLLMTNVNHWLKDKGVLRLLYSIHLMRDESSITFNLKEKI